MVRLYTDHIECWLGGACVLERTRLTHRDGQRHPRDIDYRHLIGALRRKPGAFARWVLRDAMFPRPQRCALDRQDPAERHLPMGQCRALA
jgi:hypothetical protein